MTSVGFGYADPLAGTHWLFALLPVCFANAHLRSAFRAQNFTLPLTTARARNGWLPPPSVS